MSDFPIYEIVILGAGPAGISVAAEAVSRGVKPDQILILEKSHEIIHTIKEKYPEEKPVLANYKGRQVEATGFLSIGNMTKQDFINYMDKAIVDSKVDILFNNTVTKIVKLKNNQLQVCTEKECYIANSVFVAIGSMSAPRQLSAQADKPSLQKIFYDIRKVTPAMKEVLVVGGGDSAAEYAMILRNRGHNVSLSYRGAQFSRMVEANSVALLKMIDQKQISFYAETELASVSSKDGLLEVTFSKGSNQTFNAIVAALGTDRPANYLSAIGLELCHEGKEGYTESSLTGVFAIGDVASSSGGTINIAFNSGAKALQEAYRYFLNQTG